MKSSLSRRKLFARASMLTGLGLPWGKLNKSVAKALSIADEPRANALPAGRIVDMHVHCRHPEPNFLDTFPERTRKMVLGGTLSKMYWDRNTETVLDHPPTA